MSKSPYSSNGAFHIKELVEPKKETDLEKITEGVLNDRLNGRHFMPSWKTHREIAEMFGIDEDVCNEVDKIIDSEGKNEAQWEGVEDYIKIKKLEYLTDSGSEIRETIKENFWHHDCRVITCFFIKAQTAYDNFGDEGLKAYFLHHALDVAHYFRCPKYFGIKIESLSELTRSQVRERFNWTIYGFSRKRYLPV